MLTIFVKITVTIIFSTILIIFTQNINDVCVKESKSQLLILESLYAKINVFQTLFLSSVLNTLHAFHNRIFNSGTDAE